MVSERKGDLHQALEAITQAVDHRRQIVNSYAAFALLEALERLGELSKRTGDLAQAERALDEANSIRASLRLPAIN